MSNNKKLLKNEPPPPSLSVVVVTFYNSSYLKNCLTALEQQIGSPDMEIIVVCDEIIDNVPSLRAQFPSVKFHHLSGLQTHEKLLAVGVGQARGKVVALTVNHCTPEQHWCAHIMEAHVDPYSAVGGAVEMGPQPDTAVNWAIHLYDESAYGYYQNPLTRGPAKNLSVTNVSYKRKILTSMADFWANGFDVPALNRALLAAGETIWLSPDIVVYQHRSMNFRQAIREPYGQGRSFAKIRAAKFAASKRLFYMFFSTLLPLLLLSRLIINIIRKRLYFSAVIRAFPFVLLFSILWSCGEFIGYITGKPNTILDVD